MPIYKGVNSKEGQLSGANPQNEEELEIRALLATIHHWSTKWVYAEPVQLLCFNEPIVR